MRRRLGSLVVAVSVVMALAGLVAPGAAAGATPRCAAANLRLDFVDSQGFTSHRAWDFALRNVGPATCHLQGYPGVGMLDLHAHRIPVNVSRASGFPVRNVVLKAWQRAYFSFVFAVAGPCTPHFFSAYGLEVFPPNGAQRLVWYAGRFDVCDPSVGGNPRVYPIRPTKAFPAADAAASTPPRCSSSQLKLQFVSAQGATGHRLWDFAFKNTGGLCKLRGYPRVVFLDKHGHRDTGTVKHGTGFPVTTVTVAHAKRAYFAFQYLDGGFCSGGRVAHRFEFFPPHDPGGFLFKPAKANHGTVTFCPGSTVVYPVNSTPSP